jgi:beta-mannosidase
MISTASMPLTSFSVAEADRDLDPATFLASSPTWYPAVVPGGVHESLLAAGVIDDPYVDTNEASVRWMEERDWWYRASFANVTVETGERLRLVFHGLDTVVTIWLNGELLGHHENQFRPAEFDVTGLLGAENEILLRFTPPLAGRSIPPSVLAMNRALATLYMPEGAGEAAEAAGSAEGGMPFEIESGPLSATLSLATTLRKATFSWGWDFGPRVASIGVWRPVELVRETPATIVGHHVAVSRLRAASTASFASADVVLTVQTREAVPGLVARVALTAPSGRRVVHEFPFDGDTARARVVVHDPELWWTHDLGAPNLYDVRVETVRAGSVLTALDDRVGLRTIRLDRQRDPEGGRLFRFVLNDVPVFSRGAAWVPASMLVGSVTDEKYRDLLTLARDGNMNTIRIWGGGVYENDAFYEITDELGILVWQDFMFACTDYPSLDEDLQREVELEAAYQVRRLRNRASLGLWCGNNEVQMIHGGVFQSLEPGDWGWDFFNRILPEAVDAEDGFTPYWPGSPFGEDPDDGFMAANGFRDGDRHAWEVWHGMSMTSTPEQFDSVGRSRLYRRYADDTGKFISEFGIHASPELGTLKRWVNDDDLAVHSEAFDAHNKDNPKDKHDPILEIVTGLPETLDEYAQFTMVSQAEGLKFGIEHYRRRQPHCSGTLIWQLNDAWPGFSWSVIDYDLVPKAGYYFASRAFAPVLASFRETAAGVELWVSNSTAESVHTTATISRVGFDGRRRSSETIDVDLAPSDSTSFWNGPLADDEILWVDAVDGVFPANRVFPGEVGDMPFEGSGLESTIARIDETTVSVEIVGAGYNYLVHLDSPAPGVRFSNNYFDLRDGESATITVSGLPVGFDPDQLSAAPYIGALTTTAR